MIINRKISKLKMNIYFFIIPKQFFNIFFDKIQLVRSLFLTIIVETVQNRPDGSGWRQRWLPCSVHL